jgi:hypothetical protein
MDSLEENMPVVRFDDELYAKYLDRAYTTSIWSELIEP